MPKKKNNVTFYVEADAFVNTGVKSKPYMCKHYVKTGYTKTTITHGRRNDFFQGGATRAFFQGGQKW